MNKPNLAKMGLSTREAYEEYWDRLNQSAQYHPANRYRYYLVTSRLRTATETAERPTIIDMGCGDGMILDQIRNAVPHATLFGCDVSQTVVDHNRSRMPGIGFARADITSEKWSEELDRAGIGQADVVVCSEVIEHVENDRNLLRNALKTLKPGGIFTLTTQSGPRFRVDRELLHHLRHYELATIKKMAQEEGFEVLESFCSGFPVLTAQKLLVELFFDRVMKAVASSKKPSAPARAVMSLMYWGMRLSPRFLGGPQLFLCLRKPASSSRPATEPIS